ncbi:uncharacterized protein LOC135215122 [Macrobrachium nipponense]|uniref:uncharacterized protein LOC135215122 n=1 Tax=Macrobrachium nipponense TaxID=159736 RepID=UPI0030C817B9
MKFFSFLLLLLLQLQKSFSLPEGAACLQSLGNTPPAQWRVNGQCCSCDRGKVQCYVDIASACADRPDDVSGCDFINICGCERWICKDQIREKEHRQKLKSQVGDS